MRSGITAAWRQVRVPAVLAIVEAARLGMLAAQTDRNLAGFLPDDAFYYLTLGRNFAAHARWTFDGVEPASGFHLMWGYLVAAFYWIAPSASLHAAVLVTGAVCAVCSVLATWLTLRTAVRIFGESAEPGVAIVALSTIALLTDLYPMETALALLLAAATLFMLCRTQNSTPWALGLLLGLAGSLARSDFGLLPACLFAMHLALRHQRRSSAAMVRLAAAVLAGSALGLAAVALHTHWISAHWLQSSAGQKLWWSRKLGFSTSLARALLTGFFDPGYNVEGEGRRYLLLTAGKGLLVVILLLGIVQTLRRLHVQRMFVLGLIGVLFAYLLLYSLDSAGVQPWYAGMLQSPMALLAAAGCGFFVLRWRTPTLLLVALLCVWSIAHSFRAQFPWQRKLWNAGMYLRVHPEVQPVGAWNAGVIGYFAGTGVVNLDGLVNDRILPYARTGTLLAYVQQRRLRSIIDYEIMFAPYSALRGGYASGALQRCVQAEDFQATQPDVERWMELRLYRIKPECLSLP